MIITLLLSKVKTVMHKFKLFSLTLEISIFLELYKPIKPFSNYFKVSNILKYLFNSLKSLKFNIASNLL